MRSFTIKYSPNAIEVIRSRRMRWVGHVVGMGEMRTAFKVLIGKPEGKTQRYRREDNIKVYFRSRTGTGDGLL
jgi:hypothetical protein